jgi:ABC-type lipoprotein release transport system permease subunit
VGADRTKILWTLAWRSLTSHRLQTSVVGSIVFVGAFLVVVGTALLDTVNRSMEQSVTGSIAGHLQVYSSQARDALALFGSGFFGTDDNGTLDDFAAVKAVIEKVPNVKAVVPMGLQLVTVSGGNDVDRLLGELREATVSPNVAPATLQALHQQVRSVAADVLSTADNRLAIAADPSATQQQMTDMRRIVSGELWETFAAQPLLACDFLEARLAPLGDDGRLVYLRNLGTDLQRFTALFDRFHLVRGTEVPPGQRGFLFSQRIYEKIIKNRVARALDALQEDLTESGLHIATDAHSRDLAARLPRQYQRITFAVLPEKRQQAQAALRRHLPHAPPQATFEELVQEFLRVDDANFAERYRAFYADIAPCIRLYAVNVGDNLTLRSFTKSGYLKSVNVKVYGTFEFRGLQSSDLAGAENLLDLQTFRDLYGFMGTADRAELDHIKQMVGAADVRREDAESLLFAAPTQDAQRHSDAGFDEFEDVPDGKVMRHAASLGQDQIPANINEGLAISAAIILKDPGALRVSQKSVEQALQAAHLNVQVVDWQSAAGIIGQLIVVLRIVLYVAISIIFLVALVIINNAMVMATLERVTEIGTLRAIGAQRSFVLQAFLLEAAILGLCFGLLGAAAGAVCIRLLGSVGIAAHSDVLVFLFSGPRLFPTLAASNVAFGVLSIVAVCIVSTLYPARIALRTQPIVAMQAKE